MSHWLNQTSRIRLLNDDYENTLECDWQNNLVPEDQHNSLFCSLAEWNTNITDLLEEKTYDELNFEIEEHRQKLFRHYTRILLVTSEILTDLVDFMVYVNEYSGDQKEKNNKAKKLISNAKQIGFSCQNLFDYINNVCKHKIGSRPSSIIKYHKCNHHIEYVFKDSKNYKQSSNTLRVNNIRTKKIKQDLAIEVPSLIEIIDQIVFAQKKLDRSLNKRGRKKVIRSKLKIFEEPIDLTIQIL